MTLNVVENSGAKQCPGYANVFLTRPGRDRLPKKDIFVRKYKTIGKLRVKFLQF